jgi:hypothetical protein
MRSTFWMTAQEAEDEIKLRESIVCSHDWRGIDTGKMCAKCCKIVKFDEESEMERDLR